MAERSEFAAVVRERAAAWSRTGRVRVGECRTGIDGGVQRGAGACYAISVVGSGGAQISPSDDPLLTANVDSSTRVAMVVADAAVFRTDKGWGTLSVTVGAVPDIPTCSNGRIDRRLVEQDGTAVDVGVVSATEPGSTSDSAQHYLSVTAYRPDGTVVTACTSTSGTAAQLPMTAQELTTVATAPGLDISTAVSPAESSLATRITTDQNGVASTAPKTSATPSPPGR